MTSFFCVCAQKTIWMMDDRQTDWNTLIEHKSCSICWLTTCDSFKWCTRTVEAVYVYYSHLWHWAVFSWENWTFSVGPCSLVHCKLATVTCFICTQKMLSQYLLNFKQGLSFLSFRPLNDPCVIRSYFVLNTFSVLFIISRWELFLVHRISS